MAMYEKSWNNKKSKTFIVLFFSLYMFGASDNIINLKVAGYILLSLVTIITCVTFNDKIIAGRFDYSYGIYIYAFPIQQLVINKTNLGFYTGMALSAFIVILMAAASWHIVESKFLRKTNKISQESIIA